MLRRPPKKISLPWALAVPFIVQLLGVVGIVVYLSLHKGQMATRNTLWLCLGTSEVTMIAMGLLTSRWVTHLQHYSRALEAEVQIRTAALEQEICDRKQVETQLARAKTAAETANQAKSEFLANMSHELRTPLNAILGFTQLMSHKGMANAECQDYLKIINQSGQHLLGLINDVLDMAKIEANQIDLEYTNVPLSPLLENLENLFSLKAQAKHLQLHCHIAPGSPPNLYTNASKLRQILTNVLSNAIKFTADGAVTLTVHRPAGHPEPPTLLFEVEDTGPGIAPQDLTRIFEPFIQTWNGQQVLGGTGLGLAISQQYAHLLGGTLRVSSRIGKGSCFTLTLPITAGPDDDVRHKPITVEEHTRYPLAQPWGSDWAMPQPEVRSPSVPLAITQTLGTMPRTWLQQLQRLAYHGNDQQIVLLLKELPTDQILLKHHLANLAESYQFSILVSLVDTVLTQPQIAAVTDYNRSIPALSHESISSRTS